MMVIVVGEILFDQFPTYRRLGGAPFNFAYHLKRLGIPVRFITRVGKDAEGDEILETLGKYRFRTDDIQIDEEHSTGRVRIDLDPKGVPVFDIQADVAYDYVAIPKKLAASRKRGQPNLIYFGSLVQRSPHGFKTVQEFLSTKSPEDKCLYDMNLRPDGYSDTIIFESLKQADILKLNEDEVDLIRQMIGSDLDRSDFVRFLMDRYFLEMVALTKGERGSELYVGDARYDMEADSTDAVKDTVGAGDAYAAMVAVGYLKGWDPDRILSAATRFSARLCTVEGAIPPSRFYDELRGIL